MNTNQIANAIFEKVFAEFIPSSRQSTEEAATQAKMLYEFFRYGTVKSIREVLENVGSARDLEHSS